MAFSCALGALDVLGAFVPSVPLIMPLVPEAPWVPQVHLMPSVTKVPQILLVH